MTIVYLGSRRRRFHLEEGSPSVHRMAYPSLYLFFLATLSPLPSFGTRGEGLVTQVSSGGHSYMSFFPSLLPLPFLGADPWSEEINRSSLHRYKAHISILRIALALPHLVNSRQVKVKVSLAVHALALSMAETTLGRKNSNAFGANRTPALSSPMQRLLDHLGGGIYFWPLFIFCLEKMLGFISFPESQSTRNKFSIQV